MSQRAMEMLEQLLELPAGDLKATLSQASDIVADATGADKVDGFLYDAKRDSLVAVGSSTQPLSMLQHQLGLDVLPLSNGGRVVHVFKTGKTFITGSLDRDAEELRGIKEGLGIRSKLGVPLELGSRRLGMLMIASREPDFFSDEDVRLAELVARWIGIVAHRAELVEEIARNAAEDGRRAAVEEIVAVLAHELRNYLSPLELRVELLRMRARAAARDDDLQDLEAVGKSVARLGLVVSDILEAARLDRGLFHLAPQLVDLGALVREVALPLATPARPVRVTLQEGDTINVMGDEARLRQCIGNVVANAVQVSPVNGAVSIFVRREQRAAEGAPRALVEVIDQGPGIPSDLLPRIFERFVTGGPREGGLGLGLYLAKRIAALHGGDLSAESPPGKGARFTLSLPCPAALARAASRAAPAA